MLSSGPELFAILILPTIFTATATRTAFPRQQCRCRDPPPDPLSSSTRRLPLPPGEGGTERRGAPGRPSPFPHATFPRPVSVTEVDEGHRYRGVSGPFGSLRPTRKIDVE